MFSDLTVCVSLSESGSTNTHTDIGPGAPPPRPISLAQGDTHSEIGARSREAAGQ